VEKGFYQGGCTERLRALECARVCGLSVYVRMKMCCVADLISLAVAVLCG
jgi:hypothetical protein